IEQMGYRAHTIRGQLRTVIGAIGDDRGKERLRSLESIECVESVTPILQPFKLASREVHQGPSRVSVNGFEVGGERLCVMAGGGCGVWRGHARWNRASRYWRARRA